MAADREQILSTEECLQIARNTLKSAAEDAVKIKSFDLKAGSSELIGFMGEYYKLEICLEHKSSTTGVKPLHYFVKSVPRLNPLHRAECERKGFFRKETRIYSEILPNIQRYAATKLYPECYYTRSDLIVLEDVSAEFRHLTEAEPYTEQHHHLVLRHLAKLHAASMTWEFEENFDFNVKWSDVLFELQLTIKNEWYIAGAKGIVFLARMHPKFQTPKAQNFINTRLYAVLCDSEHLTAPSELFQNAFCHRDTWDRNIFFEFDKQGVPIDCRIVDFQLSRYGSPALDLLYFLYVTTTSEQRQDNFEGYLNFYYDALSEYLKAENTRIPKERITKEGFLEDCKRARLAALILWTICEPLMKMPDGLSNKMRAEEQEKFDYYMNSERSELFLRLMAMQPQFKDIIMAPIEELLNYLLQNEELY